MSRSVSHCREKREGGDLRSLSTQTTSQLDVFGLDGDTLGMDGAQVGIFEQADQVGLDRLLQGTDGRALETQIRLEVLSDLTDQALEGEFADQELGGFLVAADFSQSDGTGLIAMGLLDTAGGGSGFAGSFGSELFTRGFATGGFAWERNVS